VHLIHPKFHSNSIPSNLSLYTSSGVNHNVVSPIFPLAGPSNPLLSVPNANPAIPTFNPPSLTVTSSSSQSFHSASNHSGDLIPLQPDPAIEPPVEMVPETVSVRRSERSRKPVDRYTSSFIAW